MKNKLYGTGLIAIVVALLAASYHSSSHAQPELANPKHVGRYQLELVQPTPNNRRAYAIVIDTATGRCFRRETTGNANWRELGSPILMMKKQEGDE